MENISSHLLFSNKLQQLTYDLGRYSALCDRVCTERLNITGSQGYTLLAIPEGDSISVNDLSLKMKLASSTMTRMVDQLVQCGLVERQPDAEDRRIVRVRLTEQGGPARTLLHSSLQGFFSQVLQAVPEGERETMLRSLETLNQAIMVTLKSCCGQDQNL